MLGVARLKLVIKVNSEERLLLIELIYLTLSRKLITKEVNPQPILFHLVKYLNLTLSTPKKLKTVSGSQTTSLKKITKS